MQLRLRRGPDAHSHRHIERAARCHRHAHADRQRVCRRHCRAHRRRVCRPALRRHVVRRHEHRVLHAQLRLGRGGSDHGPRAALRLRLTGWLPLCPGRPWRDGAQRAHGGWRTGKRLGRRRREAHHLGQWLRAQRDAHEGAAAPPHHTPYHTLYYSRHPLLTTPNYTTYHPLTIPHTVPLTAPRR